MSNPEQQEMLNAESLGEIQHTLEEHASKANSEGVFEILEEHGSAIKMNSLNNSLRSSVIGCTTTNLSEAIECIHFLVGHGANVNAEEP